MCIAIVKTKEGVITDDILKTSFENNPDGGGFVWTESGTLYIIKGIFDVDNFIKTYHEIESKADGNILIHCRISTSGLIDEDNSHPHIVNDSTALIHNGILNIPVPKESKKSDTVLFIEKYLKDLPSDFVYNKSIMQLIEDRIGSNNKFAFLNTNGDYFILNESAGYWVQGVWYSNTSYKPYTFKGYYSNKYYDNYDEYDTWLDSEYNKYYGITRDEFIKDFRLTKQEYKHIRKMIKSLSGEELTQLGTTPIYNLDTGKLREDDEFLDIHDFYLFELDDDLQNLYDTYYYQYDYGYNVEGDVNV